MADISLIVEVKQKGVVSAVKGTKALEGNVKLLSDSFKKGDLSQRQYYKGISQLAQAANKSESELRKYANELRKIEKASVAAKVAAKAESDAVKAYAQARREATEANARFNAKAKEAAAVAKANALEEERLKNKFVEGYTAMNIYTKEMNDLAVARKRGIITTNEQKDAVAQLNAQMKAGTGAFANAATGMQVVGKRANRTGVLAQQAGYQFGDFAVQVQSGTNVMVAAGQQATQLIGTFSMLAKTTRGIMAFSALGVIVPIITGLAAAFMRTREASAAAEPKVKSFSEIVDGLRDSAKDAEVELRLLHSVFDDISQLDATDRIQELQSQIESLEKSAKNVLEDFVKGLGGTQAQVDVAVGQVDSPQVQAVLDAQKKILQAKIDSLRIELEQEQSAKRLLNIEESYQELMDELLQGQQEEIDAAEELADKRKESQAAFQDQLVAQAQALTLLEMEKEGLKDSSDYRAELVTQEAARLQKLLDQKKITEQQAKDALYLYEEHLKVTAEIDASANSAKGLASALKEAASAMSSLSSFGAGLDKAIAVAAAKVGALKAGADEAVAGRIAGLRADLEVKLSDKALRPEAVADLRGEAEGKISTLEAYLTKGSALRGSKRKSGSGGGGGSNVVNINEVIAARKEQIAQDRVLLGLSGEQQAAQKIYYGLLKQNEKADIQLTEVELKGAADAIAAYEEQNRVLEEAKAQQEEVASVIADNFGSAFMSIVDGTKTAKDAFKDMARAIIKELYQIFVIKRITGFIEGFVGGLGGSSLAPTSSVRPQARPFADGGVVGGPTYFPMAGGKTGLMGEAGPEAIMPLKRGANGKLGVQMEGGSDGGVNIVQNFNFSASGDESVKKLIAQAAPQIANMTQKQIMDSRRRGGAMKSAFG